MTVGELRDMLANVRPDAEVVVTYRDESPMEDGRSVTTVTLTDILSQPNSCRLALIMD